MRFSPAPSLSWEIAFFDCSFAWLVNMYTHTQTHALKGTDFGRGRSQGPRLGQLWADSCPISRASEVSQLGWGDNDDSAEKIGGWASHTHSHDDHTQRRPSSDQGGCHAPWISHRSHTPSHSQTLALKIHGTQKHKHADFSLKTCNTMLSYASGFPLPTREKEGDLGATHPLNPGRRTNPLLTWMCGALVR